MGAQPEPSGAAALPRPLWNQLGHLIGTRITTNRFVKSALVKSVKHVELPLLGSKLPPENNSGALFVPIGSVTWDPLGASGRCGVGYERARWRPAARPGLD